MERLEGNDKKRCGLICATATVTILLVIICLASACLTVYLYFGFDFGLSTIGEPPYIVDQQPLTSPSPPIDKEVMLKRIYKLSEELNFTKSSQSNRTRACDDDGCLLATDDILASINSSVNPCNDFYHYACGGWIEDNPLEFNNMHSWKRYDKLRLDFAEFASKILMEPKTQHDSVPIKLAKEGFMNCLLDRKNGDMNFYKIPLRKPRCLDYVLKEFGLALSLKYMMAVGVDKEGYHQAMKIAKNISSTFDSAISEASFLRLKSRNNAVDRVKSMKFLLGYPDWSENGTELEKFYGETGKAYLGGEDAGWNSVEIPAAYFKNKKSIVIPGAMFQRPFFDRSLPMHQQYGGVGFVIAREMNRVFHPESEEDGRRQGRSHGKNKMEFNKTIDCLWRQYEKPHGMGIEDKIFLVNDILASTGGLQLSYRSYLDYLKLVKKEEKVLPGLEDLSNDKLFFLRFAHGHCETERTEQGRGTEKSKLPAHVLVNGALRTLDAFGKAYNCPMSENGMYPPGDEEKCHLWIN